MSNFFREALPVLLCLITIGIICYFEITNEANLLGPGLRLICYIPPLQYPNVAIKIGKIQKFLLFMAFLAGFLELLGIPTFSGFMLIGHLYYFYNHLFSNKKEE